MKSIKTIMPGRGRAGSTFLMRLLMKHPIIKPWLPEHPSDRFDVQPDCKDYLREKWPHVSPDRLFHPGDWNLVKCPEFSLVIRELLDLYPDCRFIVLDRALEERVQSSINVNATGWMSIALESNKAMRVAIEGLTGATAKQLFSKRDAMVRSWWWIHDFQLETGLMQVPENRVLRISFHDLMRDLRNELRRVFSFMKLPQFYQGKTWLDEMEKSRLQKFQLGAHQPNFWK